MARLEVIGDKYGRLTVTAEAGKDKHGLRMVLAVCECGVEKEYMLCHLRSGHTKSCGCFQKEQVLKAHKTHGRAGTRLYYVWHSMIQRCANENTASFHNYGGRGITVCDEWRNNASAFMSWAEANGYKEGLQIDRIDVNGNYDPANCRFVTNQQNNMNRGAVKNSTSSFKGVDWHKASRKWHAQIQTNGKKFHIGYFTNERDAALAYNKAAKRLFGEFAVLNEIN